MLINDTDRVETDAGTFRIVELPGMRTPAQALIGWGAKSVSVIGRRVAEVGEVTSYAACAEFGVWYLAEYVMFYDPARLPRLYLCESTVIRGTTSQELQENIALLTPAIETAWAAVDAVNYPVVTAPEVPEQFTPEAFTPGPLLSDSPDVQPEKPFTIASQIQMQKGGETADEESNS